jgi:hypothetical protein
MVSVSVVMEVVSVISVSVKETMLVVCEETTDVMVEVAVKVTTEVDGANGYFDEQNDVAGAKVDKGKKRL